jgi:xanthine/CO dehydrogenase XdhC/CoxF family maturation factor
MTNKINYLIDAYRRLTRQSTNIVLAPIIETIGSTYQKAGVSMLIEQNGEMTGLLGGGCFERDLAEQALVVFETGLSKTVFYDIRSPASVGETLRMVRVRSLIPSLASSARRVYGSVPIEIPQAVLQLW